MFPVLYFQAYGGPSSGFYLPTMVAVVRNIMLVVATVQWFREQLRPQREGACNAPDKMRPDIIEHVRRGRARWVGKRVITAHALTDLPEVVTEDEISVRPQGRIRMVWRITPLLTWRAIAGNAVYPPQSNISVST